MSRNILILLACFFVIQLSICFTPFAFRPAHAQEDVQYISLVALIAHPEQYHAKIVKVMGYINLEFEGNAIVLNEEQFENTGLENAIRLNVDVELHDWEYVRNNGHYCTVTGVFSASQPNWWPFDIGTLDKVKFQCPPMSVARNPRVQVCNALSYVLFSKRFALSLP